MYRIADFYLPDHRLIVEIDGGYHATPEQRAADQKTDTLFLKERGIRKLRLSNELLLSGRILRIG